MITTVRSATINQGKSPEAFEHAIKVANYINENISGANLQVMRNIGGQLHQVHWVANYDSLAAMEEVAKTIQADPGLQELMAESRQQQLFVTSSFVDSLYQSVP